MVNTTLRAYLDELNLLLEQEALEEVIGHCRHILQHFPKNVETYRLLGRALLEKARHDEAGDVFQRVLSALPDDFVSHLGLSGVAEERGDIPTAIWHLERAYEQEPNNMALQGELKRLYERRDGSTPDRIQLTPSALVRIYAKGRLYEQAVTELRNALQQAPDRVDLLLLQSDILWNNDRLVEAGEVALRVLEKLPNSIEANKLLASLWLKSGRPSDAQPFLTRLAQLDPFLTWEIVQPDGKTLPPNAFQLARLDWDARAAAALATDVPDWVSAISNVFEAPESIPLTGGVTNWLEGVPPAPAATNAPADEPVGLPDWMQEMAPSPTPPADKSAALQTDVPDWFKDSPTSVGDSESIGGPVLPDWFAEEEMPAPAQPAPASTPGLDASWLEDDFSAAPTEEQLPSGFTDLLAGSAPRHVTAPLEDTLATDANLLPDWMAEEAPTTPSTEAAPQSRDAISWLSTGPLPPLAEPEQPADAGLDFLAESPAEPTAELAGESEVNLDDWLSSMPGSEPPAEAAEPAMTADAGLDWLSGVTSSEPPAESMASSSLEEIDLGDWLNEMPGGEAASAATPAEAAEPAMTADAGLDWLSGVTSGEPPAEPAPAAFSPAEIDLGDWLNEMPSGEPASAAAPTEPAMTEDAGLDWLSGVSSDQPAQPADSGLDWLSSMPSAQEPPVADHSAQAESGEELFELSGRSSSEDWYSSQPATEEAPATEGDPMAWLRPYTEGADTAPDSSAGLSSVGDNGFGAATTEDEEPVQAETPDWLSAMRPPAAQPADEKAPLEELDLGLPGETSSEPAPAQEGDWLSSLSAAQPAEPAKPGTGSLDWLSQPASQAEEPSIELEDDWLASFEAGAAENTGAVPESPAQPVETAAETPADWFGALSSEEPVSSAEPAPAQDDWLGSLGIGRREDVASDVAGTEPTPAENAPAWMQEEPVTEAPASSESSGWLSPDAKDHFDSLLKTAAEKANQPRVVKDTGVLEPGALPDWMAAFGGSTGESTEPPSAKEPVPEPDWLNTSASPKSAELTGEAATDGESVPAWLSAMAPGSEPSAASPIDDLDFSSLESALSVGSSASEAKPETGTSADRDAFAKSADLVNTGLGASNQPTDTGKSFSFDRPPAWMRKKGASPKPSKGKSPGGQDEDLPDWLRE